MSATLPRQPDRTDLRLRVAISVLGLALLGVGLSRHGIANAAALSEVLAVAGLVFGVTLVRALRALARARRE